MNNSSDNAWNGDGNEQVIKGLFLMSYSLCSNVLSFKKNKNKCLINQNNSIFFF